MMIFKKKFFLYLFIIIFNLIIVSEGVLANSWAKYDKIDETGCYPFISCDCDPNKDMYNEVCGLVDGKCQFLFNCAFYTNQESCDNIKVDGKFINSIGQTIDFSYPGCIWEEKGVKLVDNNDFSVNASRMTEYLSNPMSANSINSLIGKIINTVMGVVGSLALLMFVYGGITWMTAAGSDERVKKGKNILVWSALGLIAVFAAYALTKFVINLAT